MPHLTAATSKGTAFSRKPKTSNSGGTTKEPSACGVSSADQTPSFHIRPANDASEQQADRIAAQITHQVQSGAPIERSAEGVKTLNERGGQPEGQAVAPKTATQIAASQGKGQPLPPAVREPAEKALGRSLVDVRLHTGAKASSLNREVGAAAFAVQKDIFMGEQLDLSKPEGQEVALHEAVHTQQKDAGPGGASSSLQKGDEKWPRTKKTRRIPNVSPNVANALRPDIPRQQYGRLPPVMPDPVVRPQNQYGTVPAPPQPLQRPGQPPRQRRGAPPPRKR